MLRYFAHGTRRYGRNPTPAVGRVNWEFFAVVEGNCAPSLPGRAPIAPRKNTLWVFPPQSVHGWIGDKRGCDVVVLHFGAVPSVLEQRALKEGFLEVQLCDSELKTILRIASELEPHFKKPTTLSSLFAQKAKFELSLLVMGRTPEVRLDTVPTVANDKVDDAIAIYNERVAERLPVASIAEAVHVSASHLRRLFLQVRSESPKSVFTRITMDRAMELLTQTMLKQGDIAIACGFAGDSEFSRAFKRHFKVPPTVWRNGILPPHKHAVRIEGHLVDPHAHHATVERLRKYAAAPIDSARRAVGSP